MTEYRDKLLSIGVLGKAPKTKRSVEQTPTGTVVHTEHRDGRVDATVKPETVRYGARVHKSGRKKGEIAEIRRKGNP